MTLPPGLRLGPYEVEALLGAGGMGEVYRARDTRLGRVVALKVLPRPLAEDADRRARFEREARAIASLNHPHICTLYDVGQQDGLDFLVMEHVEGESLAHRLLAGPLPLDDVLRNGIEIARGLQRAHRQGIVHRDLKPANVMLTRSGVKLLDFGLAKLATPVAEGNDTLSARPGAEPLTREGTYLGTLPYMAPEQLEGRPADSRSDIWSLGTVLYEMATGRRAFAGTSQAGLVGAILTKEPAPLASVQAGVPAPLERAVHTCLAKDPDERWQDAGDVARELEWIRGGGSQGVRARRPRGRWRTRAVLAAAAAAVALAGGWALTTRGLLRVGPPPPVPRFLTVTLRHGIVSTARFAPDGQGIVYTASWEGEPYELFLTSEGATEGRPLGLSGMRLLALSTHGEMAVLRGEQSVNRGRGVLARAPLSGGALRDLAEDVLEADWTPDGSELAALRAVVGKQQVEFPLGNKVFEGPAVFHLRVSPDGTRVAFYDRSPAGHDVVTVDRAGRRVILSRGWQRGGIGGLAWSPRGDEVVFSATRGLTAPSLHAVSLSGRERPLARAPKMLLLQDVFADGRALVTTGPARGGMACRTPGQPAERDLGWLDYPVVADLSADGAVVLFTEQRGGGGAAGGAIYLRRTDGSPAVRLGEGRAVSLSPDGKWVLATLPAEASRWRLLPTGAGVARTLPPVPGDRVAAGSWLPDGTGIVFTAATGTAVRTYVQDVDTGAIRPVTPEGAFLIQHSVTPDGRFALAASGRTVRLYPVGQGEPQPVAWLAGGDFLGWNTDGSMAFVARPGRGRHVEIHRVDVATGRAQPWTTLVPDVRNGVEGIGSAVVSRDGRSYCYSYDQQLRDLYVVDGLDLAPRSRP